MKQLLYVKNDLVERDNVNNVFQQPIQSRFGIRRPSIVNSEKAQACLVAFNTVCIYIGTRLGPRAHSLVLNGLFYHTPLTDGKNE
jgi:hypothetical protein